MRCYFGTKPGSNAYKYCFNLQQWHLLLQNILNKKWLQIFETIQFVKIQTCTMPHFKLLWIWYTRNWYVIYVTCHKISTVLQSAVTENPQKQYQASRFTWTTYAKSLGKICYIARIHNTGPVGQMWPARSLKMARMPFTECSQCFSSKTEALSAAIVNWQHDAVQKHVFIYKWNSDVVPGFEKYVELCEDLRENFKTLSRWPGDANEFV